MICLCHHKPPQFEEIFLDLLQNLDVIKIIVKIWEGDH